MKVYVVSSQIWRVDPPKIEAVFKNEDNARVFVENFKKAFGPEYYDLDINVVPMEVQ